MIGYMGDYVPTLLKQEISNKQHVSTVIKTAIRLGVILSSKTSYSVDDYYVNDC